MHITLEADYAVRIVNCLAACPQTRMDAKSIAAQTGVTLRFSLKILRKLVAKGIVRSFKGTQGGYELSRAPENITLGEVIETVEGPITISRCVGEGNFVCTCDESHPSGCRFNRTYKELSELIRERLYKTSFGPEESSANQ